MRRFYGNNVEAVILKFLACMLGTLFMRFIHALQLAALPLGTESTIELSLDLSRAYRRKVPRAGVTMIAQVSRAMTPQRQVNLIVAGGPSL